MGVRLLGAFFPANVNMAVNADGFRAIPRSLLWARLPVAWVWRVAVR